MAGEDSIGTKVVGMDLRADFLEQRAKAEGNSEYLDLLAGFRGTDVLALDYLASLVERQGMRVADVGAWKGMSTSVLGKLAKAMGGTVFAIDHWLGNAGTWNVTIARDFDVFSIFKNNLRILGLSDVVQVIRAASQDAIGQFADNSLDLVFIDADHCYAAIHDDIRLWLPKVRVGGILCGHDCERYYSALNKDERNAINACLHRDDLPEIAGHPGVIKAVYDVFGDDYGILPYSSVWYVVRNKEAGYDKRSRPHATRW